ncbi:DDE-type integrase/transposase/recombinase [Saccharospirillum alexandrii]|uniref:DDE-type integrase/transposase/recombinase n=1 Tax=Saccharospirillum alexandrii TaxID=2448477 RepID=UPI0013DFE94C|nr:DDE-type integrase/transposase/recombinase [Saccharospirillum alexandrii]
MLKNLTIDNAPKSWGLTLRGVEIINTIRSSEPARRVSANGVSGNIAIRFPSKKMSRIIQAESKTLEYPVLLSLEFDPDVLEFYDQPPTVFLQYITSNGRRFSGGNTLDYFAITNSGAYYVECKRKEELLKISRKRPDHVSYDEISNRFYSPAFDRYLDGSGIGYRFITEEDINKVESENLDLLYGYQQENPTQSNINRLRNILKEEGFVHIDTLVGLGVSLSEIYHCIQTKICFFPISTRSLLHVDDRTVYASESHYKLLSAYKSGNTKDSDFNFNVENLDSELLSADGKDLERATYEFSLLHNIESTNDIESVGVQLGISTRSVYRKLKKIEEHSKSPIAALLPRKSHMGNRNSKIDPQIMSIIKAVSEEYYQSRTAVSKSEVHRIVKIKCQSKNLPAPTITTVSTYLNQLSDVQLAYSRVSGKKSYQMDIFNRGLEGELPFSRATRYLQHCHLDHTQIDLFTLTDNLKQSQKPWLTAIRDSYTGIFLGHYLTFRHPSYINVMMCIRNMVDQWGLVPESIFVDGGRELNCRSIERLCARYSISKTSREGNPKAGTTIERAFGVLNSKFFHNLEGNSKASKNVRQLTARDLPSNQAVWRLSDIDRLLVNLLQEYNRTYVEKGELSCLELSRQSIRMFGIKPDCKVSCDDEFFFNTLPTVNKGYVTIRKGRPVRYEKMDYWNVVFHQASPKGEQCDARWDPEDYRSLYIYFDKRWIKATTTAKVNVNTERRIISEELAIEQTAKDKANRNNSYKLTASIHKEKEAIVKFNGPSKMNKYNKVDESESVNDKVAVKPTIAIKEEAEYLDPWSLQVPNSIDRRK